MSSITEQCPWCGSTISRQKFLEVQTKIRQEEQKKLETAKAVLTAQLEERHRRELVIGKQAAAKHASEEATKKIAAISAERDTNAKKIKELEAREALVRKQAQKEAESHIQKELTRQRQLLEKDRDLLVLKKQAEFNREREGYQKKMKGLMDVSCRLSRLRRDSSTQ